MRYIYQVVEPQSAFKDAQLMVLLFIVYLVHKNPCVLRKSGPSLRYSAMLWLLFLVRIPANEPRLFSQRVWVDSNSNDPLSIYWKVSKSQQGPLGLAD